MTVPEIWVLAGLSVIIAGVVAVGMFRLLSPSSGVETPAHLGRKWLAWSTAGVTLTLLPKFLLKLDGETFLSWLIAATFCGGLAYLVGWVYGLFLFKYRRISPAISTVLNVPATTVRPAVQPVAPQSVSPTILPDGGRRLVELKEIFERGLISKQEYDTKREAIIAQL